MKLRQSRDREILSQYRRIKVGEVDQKIDLTQLEESPSANFSASTIETCEAIHWEFIRPGLGSPIPRRLFYDLPIWVFLEYAIARKGLLLHGSNDVTRQELTPQRRSFNVIGWDKPMHFAYRSSTEALFAAVLDTHLLEILDCQIRSSVATKGPDIAAGNRRFYYGVDYRALPHGPWTTGAVYFYRAADFPADYELQPFLSDRPLRPLARLHVTPEDWPMLGKVSGVDVVALNLRARESYQGYPWRRDDAIHPHIKHEEKVATMAAFLDSNLEQPVDLPTLGKLVDTGPFAAMRVFRASRGLSPHKYHLRLRIERAKELLKEGVPVGQLAAECGFADQSHLIRHFRKDLGLTPGQYLRAQESSIRGF